jgi:hypothetical protein
MIVGRNRSARVQANRQVRGVLRTIEMFGFVVLGGLALAVVFQVSVAYLGEGAPWNSFLYTPQERFSDWYTSVAAVAKGIPVYFPFSYLVFLLGAELSRPASIAAYLVISLCLLIASIVIAWRRLRPARAGRGQVARWHLPLLLLSCLLSYPVLFALDRGNLEVCIASLCVVHVATLRTRYEPLGFAALAIAIALKMYPLAFLALAVAERKYRSAFLCAAAAGLMTVVPLAVMWNGFAANLDALVNNLHRYHEVHVVGPMSMYASSDPYNGIRAAIVLCKTPWQGPGGPVLWSSDFVRWSRAVLHVYNVFSLIFALIAALFVLTVPAPRWRRVLAVCLVAILFPNLANDYKLTLLLPGLLLLLLEPDTSARGKTAFVLLCLLMIPKSYWFIDDIGLTMIINPLLLISLSICVMADRRAWRRGLRLLRFRIVWHVANLDPDAWLRRAITLGRPTPFLAKDHKTMDLA